MGLLLGNRKRKAERYFIFLGDSLSGGLGLNSQATSGEISQRSSVQLWKNLTNDGWYDLKISDPDSNNQLGHTGFTSYIGVTHGLELQLANIVENGGLSNPTYLIKAGHGGSNIDQWDLTDTYYTTFVSRITAAKTYLRKKTPIMFFSLGTNDAAIASNNSWTSEEYTQWKNKIINLIQRFKSELPSIQIYAVRIREWITEAGYINNELELIESQYSYFNLLDITDVTYRDSYHPDYAGQKVLMNQIYGLI